MNHDEAAAVAGKITAGIEFPFSNDWSDVTHRGDTSWVTDLLSKIVALIGELAIEHVSGWVEDEGEVKGEIVVLTSRSLIRADFVRPRQTRHLTANVSGVPRSAVRRVSIESVAPIQGRGHRGPLQSDLSWSWTTVRRFDCRCSVTTGDRAATLARSFLQSSATESWPFLSRRVSTSITWRSGVRRGAGRPRRLRSPRG